MFKRFILFRPEFPDGGGGAPPAVVDPPAPAPAPIAAPAPAAPAPAAEAWQGPSRDEWEATQTFVQLVASALSEEDPPDPVAPAAPPALDLSNPQAIIDLIESKSNERAEAIIGDRFGPYQPVMDQMVAEEGKKLVLGELEKIAKGDPERGVEGIGEFNRDLAAKLAQAYFHPSADPRQVLMAAAKEAQMFGQSERTAALGQERGALQNRLDAGNTPSGPAADAQPGYPEGAPPGLDKYQLTAWRWEQNRAGRGSPVG